jgi:hypothetical protein
MKDGGKKIVANCGGKTIVAYCGGKNIAANCGGKKCGKLWREEMWRIVTGKNNVTNCGGNSRDQQTDELVKGPMPPLSRTFLRIPMLICSKQPRYTTPTTMAAPEAATAAADRRRHEAAAAAMTDEASDGDDDACPFVALHDQDA